MLLIRTLVISSLLLNTAFALAGLDPSSSETPVVSACAEVSVPSEIKIGRESVSEFVSESGEESAGNPAKEPVNVLQEGRTYLALSSDERGYSLKFESPQYRAFLKETQNTRALDLCHEAGYEFLDRKPKTSYVKSPQPLEAWTVVDGQWVQANYENVRPWIFTNNGCQRMTPAMAAAPTLIGFGVGAIVSFATIPVMGPGGIMAGITCVGGLLGTWQLLYTLDAKVLLPIRGGKAFERLENEVVRHHPLPLPSKAVVKHKIFTEVFCK